MSQEQARLEAQTAADANYMKYDADKAREWWIKMKTNQKIVLFVALEEEIPVGSVKFPVVYMGIGKV